MSNGIDEPAPVAGRRVFRFSFVLAAIAVAALIFRISYNLALRNHFPSPDGLFYGAAAMLLRNGHGFVNPLTGAPTAFHPPAWTLVLTIPRLLGQDSQFASQVFASLLGVATVVAIGFAGRRIGGERAGLIAAFLAALYPGLWTFEQALLSETLLFLVVVLMIIAAYRYIEEPSQVRAVILGGLCGLAALTRSEQLLLVPMLLVPLILGWQWRKIDRGRIESLAIACVSAAVLITPWTIYNLGRLHEPVLLSTSFGSALAQGNCDGVYYGKNIGYFDVGCVRSTAVVAAKHGATDPLSDSSLRRAALSYMSDHIGRLPLVVVAREGRAWSLYKPFETAKTQFQFPQRPWWPQGVDLFFYWTLLPLAVIGGFVLRARRTSLLPLVVPFVVTLVAVATTYGEPRLRAGAEVPLVLLAAVGIERLFVRLPWFAPRPVDMTSRGEI